MSAGNDGENRDDWSAEEKELKELFARTAVDPEPEALERMAAQAAEVGRLAAEGTRLPEWRKWAVAALVAAAAALALVLLAGLPERSRTGGQEPPRTAGAAPADVIEAYRNSADTLPVVTAAEQVQDYFADQFEDPFEWDDDPGLLDGLAVLAGPGSVEDPEAWEQF